MERMALKAVLRETKNSKGELNRMRRAEQIPAIVYGKGQEAIPVIVEAGAIRQVISTEAGLNAIVDIEISNGGKIGKETVMIKHVQRDIMFQERLLHIDFIRISLLEKITVNVPLNFVGDSPGVKEAGVLQALKREVEVKCLPTSLPDMIEVDISGLGIGDSILIQEIALPEGVEIIAEPDEPVVQVLSAAKTEENVPVARSEGAGEGKE